MRGVPKPSSVKSYETGSCLGKRLMSLMLGERHEMDPRLRKWHLHRLEVHGWPNDQAGLIHSEPVGIYSVCTAWFYRGLDHCIDHLFYFSLAHAAIISEHSPAPFCLSVSAPFWVGVYQEQIASKKGERLRESIEIRSCKDSGMPCYVGFLCSPYHQQYPTRAYFQEMKPLVQDTHPFFKERVYLGQGVIRIDRSVHIQHDQEVAYLEVFNSVVVALILFQLREFFSDFVSTRMDRQYRIELPWRQIPGRPDPGYVLLFPISRMNIQY